jgi:hypothetical protein
METYLIVSAPYNLLESRRSYFTKPYYCDVPRNIRLPLWSDHDIAGLHRIISIFNKRKLGRCIVGHHKKMSEAYQINKMYAFYFNCPVIGRNFFFMSSFLLLNGLTSVRFRILQVYKRVTSVALWSQQSKNIRATVL